ncbi:hypothetical protein AAKU67_001318 [Oxalobacteraceae bacterium GrIS 2.11]
MNTTNKPTFLSVLVQSASFGLQWRLIVLWIIVLLIPTAIMTLPLWQIISSQLSHSVQSGALAHQLSMNAINDIISAMVINKLLLQEAGLGALIFTLLLSPFLSGAIVTAARSATPLAMGKLVHGGIAEYWRMLRMLLVAIVPFGIAGAIIAGVMHWSDGYAEKAILESDADFASHISLAVMAILLIIADATLDAGRAQFIHSTTRRSAFKAWWRGLVLVVKRPLSALGFYVVLTLVGVVAAAVFGLLRMNLGHVGVPGFIVSLILTQLIVASTAWMKSARLYALALASK